jgi:hypothetical protein
MTAQETKNIERLATESADLARKSLKKSNELEAYLGLLDYRAGKVHETGASPSRLLPFAFTATE